MNRDGFTLVEVIAVLVILGILAAVAIPKFFDMQATARNRALDGAIGELNGQVALAFAQAFQSSAPISLMSRQMRTWTGVDASSAEPVSGVSSGAVASLAVGFVGEVRA